MKRLPLDPDQTRLEVDDAEGSGSPADLLTEDWVPYVSDAPLVLSTEEEREARLAHADQVADDLANHPGGGRIDYADEPLKVLSMGGGVQSSAMLLLIDDGLLPRPDVVVMSDTGSELRETDAHVRDRLVPFCEEVLGIPFVIVSAWGSGERPATGRGSGTDPSMLPRSSLHADFMKIRKVPLIGNRSCTESYKVAPFRRWVRQVVGPGNGPPHLAEVWLGITSEEAHRARDADVRWLRHVYPLVHAKAPLSRRQCIDRLVAHGWGDTVKSGCFCCPYQGRKSWLRLQRDHPDLWEKSVEMDLLAAASGVRMGLWSGSSPKGRLDSLTIYGTLDDWGIAFAERDVDPGTCDHEGGGCFL